MSYKQGMWKMEWGVWGNLLSTGRFLLKKAGFTAMITHTVPFSKRLDIGVHNASPQSTAWIGN